MVTSIELFEKFMNEEYLIISPKGCLDDIVKKVFPLLQYREEMSPQQIDLLYAIRNDSRGSDLVDQIRRVFASSYPSLLILEGDDSQIQDRFRWLGEDEHELAVNEKLIEEYPESKGVLLEKSIEHLLTAKEKGDDSQKVTNLIVDSYVKLQKHNEALNFLLRERDSGQKTRRNARQIHGLFILLKDYESGLDFHLKEWDLGDKIPSTFNSIIYLYSKLGEYRKALRWFEQNQNSVEEIFPETVYFIAKCHYMSTEQEEEVLKRYENEPSQQLQQLSESRMTGKDQYIINGYKSKVEKESLKLKDNVLNKLEEALGWALKAEELGAESKENLKLIGRIYHDRGILKKSQDDFEKSLNYHIRAMSLNGKAT